MRLTRTAFRAWLAANPARVFPDWTALTCPLATFGRGDEPGRPQYSVGLYTYWDPDREGEFELPQWAKRFTRRIHGMRPRITAAECITLLDKRETARERHIRHILSGKQP